MVTKLNRHCFPLSLSLSYPSFGSYNKIYKQAWVIGTYSHRPMTSPPCCIFQPLLVLASDSKLLNKIKFKIYWLSSLLTTLSVSIHGFSFKWKSMLYLIAYILEFLNLQSPGWSMADSWSRQASKWQDQHTNITVHSFIPESLDWLSVSLSCWVSRVGEGLANGKPPIILGDDMVPSI